MSNSMSLRHAAFGGCDVAPSTSRADSSKCTMWHSTRTRRSRPRGLDSSWLHKWEVTRDIRSPCARRTSAHVLANRERPRWKQFQRGRGAQNDSFGIRSGTLRGPVVERPSRLRSARRRWLVSMPFRSAFRRAHPSWVSSNEKCRRPGSVETRARVPASVGPGGGDDKPAVAR